MHTNILCSFSGMRRLAVVMGAAFLCLQAPEALLAQKPFAGRFGVSAFMGHNKLVGDMDTYLQGDLFGAARLKYNLSQRLAVEASIATGKRFMNRLEIPEIPILTSLDGIDEANFNTEIVPILLNVNYYFSQWDSRPYATIGAGYYNVSSDLFVSFDDPLANPPFLLEANEKMMGMNVGAGMESFLTDYLSFEIRVVMNFLFYSAPEDATTFKFPIDSPRFLSFGLGLTYYFN